MSFESPEFLWFLPARGDGRLGDASLRKRGEWAAPPFGPGVSDPRGQRFNYFDHLHQIARAAELSGFDGLQIEHDPAGDESWIIAGYLARGTRRLKLVTEFEASWGSAVYAAKNAATFQRYTGGRLGWYLREGAGAAARRRGADVVPDADVVPRIEEFLQVARGVLTQAPFSFKGRFFEVADGGFREGLDHQVVPPVYLAGQDAAGLALSAAHADVHVFAPGPNLDQRIAGLQAQAERKGRRLRFGLRLELLARPTAEEAQRDAARARGQGAPEPHLVGSYQQVAEALEHHRAGGIDTFLLGSVPHLEEAYRIGAHVLPLLSRPARPTTSVSLGATP